MSYLDFAKVLAITGLADQGSYGNVLSARNPSYSFPDDLWTPGQDPFIYFNIRKAVGDLKPYGNISLYMPPTIQVNHGAGWDELSLTSEKTKALTGFNTGDVLGTLGKGNFSEAFNKLKDSLGNGANAESIMQYAIGNIAGATLGGSSVEFEVRKAMAGEGKAVNPFTSMLYQGPRLRQFQFDFHLMAKSPMESDSITRIIRAFKTAMHPQTDQASAGLFYIYPYVFDIILLTPEVDKMFNIKRAALTDMTVDYAGGVAPSFFMNTWAPVNIKMTLSFKELELLTQQDITDNY